MLGVFVVVLDSIDTPKYTFLIKCGYPKYPYSIAKYIPPPHSIISGRHSAITFGKIGSLPTIAIKKKTIATPLRNGEMALSSWPQRGQGTLTMDPSSWFLNKTRGPPRTLRLTSNGFSIRRSAWLWMIPGRKHQIHPGVEAKIWVR